jgi:hypothetical protein
LVEKKINIQKWKTPFLTFLGLLFPSWISNRKKKTPKDHKL